MTTYNYNYFVSLPKMGCFLLIVSERAKQASSVIVHVNRDFRYVLSASERSERAQSLFMSIEISDICIYICAVRTSTSMRMPKKSLLRNGLSN